VRELADSLREEEGPNDVRVTTVYPAGTATSLLERVRAGFGQTYDPDTAITPHSVAALVVDALEAPSDVHLVELSGPKGAADSATDMLTLSPQGKRASSLRLCLSRHYCVLVAAPGSTSRWTRSAGRCSTRPSSPRQRTGLRSPVRQPRCRRRPVRDP
jgi:hypothetical protein